MKPDKNKTMHVEPKPGRTVRFPVGHPKHGEQIPKASDTPGSKGSKVPVSAYYIRALNCGDLRKVRSSRPPKGQKTTAASAPSWPESFSGMKKDELVELAGAHGVNVAGMTKNEILGALKDAREASEEG
jgi:hypothetical protein